MSSSNNLDRQSLPIISGYTILETLYLGSRTAVYRAAQTATQQSVVIKVLRREYPSFGELVQFRNQYAITKNLPIPGIVHPLSLEPLGSGYALVMPDWGGIALNKHLQQQSLNLTEVLAIALQLADILHDLAQHRVVHKDIKPANILIQPESKQVKLIDFSIASLLPKETQEIQSANILEGTLAYLAPEQTGRMNRGIDYRADFYALGVTLYQLLTGKLPFESNDPLELMHCHIAKMPLSVDRVNPDVPGMVAAIVSKLIAKNAEDRYQSAMGLKHDLEQCLTQWTATGEISEFELGQRDLSDRFIIPEKLYGRQTEVQTLLQAFDRVASGSSELMLVAGFSGIGKTAVVNEVHKPIVRQRGYFIKGKFDQFNRNIPLSAFVQALRDLMGQLLSESDTQVAQWQAKILAAVGENGQVLIEVIPELEQIIGKQPIAPELSGTAAQNRFNLLFQKFIEVFTTAEHPLVMFLDDLQWADSASLQLLKLLMNDNAYLLLLGAYRDNEVSPTHPFIVTVAQLQKAQHIVNTITLKSLAVEDTNHLVADTLNCSPALAQPLTELVDRKTQGNPFFTTQFLKALHDDGYIRFDCDRRYWECDITQVNTLALTDDVVEFMAVQLQKLTAETQQVLKLAACIGNQFDLDTLAIVSEQSQTDVATALWKALQEGLILPTSQIYKFFQDTEQGDTQSNVNPTYRFLHDRVQQAAYSLIPDEQKQATHLKIGQHLLHSTTPEQREDQIFAIVSQLNMGVELIQDTAQRQDLAQLNLIASCKARAATAYSSAANYIATGIDLLLEASWQVQYELTLALYQVAAETAYLNGDFDEMAYSIDQVLQHAKMPLDKVAVYEIRVEFYIAQNNLLEAIETGLEILQQLGINFPNAPSQTEINAAFQETTKAIGNRTPVELLHLPEMQEARYLAALRIMMTVVPATFIAQPALFPLFALKPVYLSVTHGNATTSAFAYSLYALLLCGAGEVSSGYEFAQLALNLLDRSPEQALKPKTFYTSYAFSMHWAEHLGHSLQPLKLGYLMGMEVGDLAYTGYCSFEYSTHAYYAGQPLLELVEEVTNYRKVLDKINQKTTFIWSAIYHQTFLNLIGAAEHPTQLIGEVYDERIQMSLHQSASDRVGLINLLINKLVLAYLFEDYSLAVDCATKSASYLDAITSKFAIAIFYFYDALAQLAIFSDASEEQRVEILEHVAKNQEKLCQWAQHAPMNHQHKLYLVKAEQHRSLSQHTEAIEYYDRAIAGAKANGYIQEEALANELAAKFYLAWGKEKVAAGYLQEAYYGYAHWGAAAKVNDLEQRYPDLLRSILEKAQSFNPLDTLATLSEAIPKGIAASHVSIHASTQTSRSSSSSSINATLDFAAVLRASQSLSSTIQLDDLLYQLTQIILQHSGADRCALILPNTAGEWKVRAVATPTDTQICHAPLQDNPDLPTKLIYYVKNTKEVAIVDDCETDLPVIDDYLTQRQPKSILCLPILNQGNLIGILYLKNRLTRGVFTRDRILILNFLCTQAAISLENARLYQQSQTTLQELQQSQQVLREIIDNIPQVIFWKDRNSTYLGCNQKFAIQAGLNSSKDIIGKTDYELPWSKEESDSYRDYDRKVMESNQPELHIIETQQQQDGSTIWLDTSKIPLCNEAGEVYGILGSYEDISDRKRTETALLESETKFRRLVEDANDIIWSSHLDSTLTYLSPQFGEVFGWAPEEWLGQSFVPLVHPEDLPNVVEFINRVVESGEKRAGQEFRHRHKDGSFRCLISNVSPIKDESGRVIGLQGIMRDISDRKQAEQAVIQKSHELEQALAELQNTQLQMVQGEKMASLGNLVAGVAHEINNPIGFLNGSINHTKDYVQDLLGHLALYQQYHPNPATPVQENAEEIDLEFLSEDLPKMLDSMESASDRIKGISTSLRTFSRADTEYKVSANLHDGIDSTLLILKYRLKANEYRPAIEVIQDYGDLPLVDCFPGQLNQVFMNILANAIDALDESNIGRSFVEIQANPNRITIRTTVENGQVKIAIADNGPGISEEVKSRMFDHLFTTKRVGKGTGLGLAIARQIVVEKHGGAIDVNSEVGKGTEFVLNLPIG